MPIPLPNLDDRRWSDLVEQGRALIPLYAPGWTNHNASDPGITLMELFASVAEMDIYRLNRLTRAQQLRLLALLDVHPVPAQPAIWASELLLQSGTAPMTLPPGSEFSGTLLDGSTALLRAKGTVDVVAAGLQAVLREEGGIVRNVTAAWLRGESLSLFGDEPVPGAACCFGFDAPLPAGMSTQLYFAIEGEQAGTDERARIAACDGTAGPLLHHAAQVAWEYLDDNRVWSQLEAHDDTRAFSLAGTVQLRPARQMRLASLERNAPPCYWVRCRFARGAFDAPPRATTVLVNGVELVQSVPVTTFWPIAKGTVVTGSLTPGQPAALRLTLREGVIVALAGDSRTGTAGVPVLAYTAADADTPGLLVIEGKLAGMGNGEPCQHFALDPAVDHGALVEASVRLFSAEGEMFRPWTRVDDITASTRRDAHFQLDTVHGVIQLGDGEQGRVLPEGSQLFACYESLQTIPALAKLDGVADTPHNRVHVPPQAIAGIRAGTLLPVKPAADEETLAHAIGRAITLREAPLRAVTAADFEAIAVATPGVRVARAIARPNLHSELDCVAAPGMITVIVLPALPRSCPQPTPGFIARIAAWLDERRTIGTRVVVAGPQYLEVAVHARARARPGMDRQHVAAQIAQAIDAFLDPLAGGPDGTGWPLGRPVYRAEIMQVIDETPGADHVLALELTASHCEPVCGNLCLRPTWLVRAGTHHIEVV